MKNTNYVIKFIAAIVFAAIISLPSSAQEKEEISTLFGNNDGHASIDTAFSGQESGFYENG